MSDSDVSAPGAPSVLVVDDEPDIAALVAYHLARESYRVRTVASGPEALRAVELERPDLVVLDVMLPGVSGLDVLEELRRRPETSEVPVLLLTARKDEQDRIAGFRVGADDYVAKPFSPTELVLRVGAVLRRVRRSGQGAGAGRVLRRGPFRIDVEAARASVDGRELELTPTEYRLLHTLVERAGRVQSRKQLLDAVWEVQADIATRTVDMHVQRLRSKLGGEADWIETVRGFGYRMRTEPPG
ncbi:MAG TPA: response regulator transcription factor [Longimicrobiaceae bacterium]|nr:response regulator transcription factor [Longimicrobiaceae bacterium]